MFDDNKLKMARKPGKKQKDFQLINKGIMDTPYKYIHNIRKGNIYIYRVYTVYICIGLYINIYKQGIVEIDEFFRRLPVKRTCTILISYSGYQDYNICIYKYIRL